MSGLKTRTSPFRHWVTPVVIIAMAATVLGFAWLAPERAAALGMFENEKIHQLIYPTFGNPAIVRKGETFTLEFDPRLGTPGALAKATDWEISVQSSVDRYPVTGSLQVTSFLAENSKVWPNLSDFQVWRVRVRVPESLPEDLYDLTVKGKIGGTWITDSQPHALQAVNEIKDRFSFCQLTDIHVFGPECSYPSSNHKERNNRHTDYRPDDDGYGAKYYHKTIQQLNRTRPDFCIFSGDYMFGQKYFTKSHGAPWGTTTEYEYEMLWFYQETLKLEVPVFVLMGNHDGYAEPMGQAAGEDWHENWKKLWGPLYYSFDYNDCHFTLCNSMDWSRADRELFDWLGIIMQPGKYLGQFRGGGDTWQKGCSEARLAAIDESRFTGQLAWMRDDLKSHQSSRLRVMVMHHDPWKDTGSGSMWEGLVWPNMGDGEGRLASIRLAKDYRVSLVLSGHDHSDFYGEVPWSDGSGKVQYANTTSVSFQADGNSDSYPGYRRVFVNDGSLGSFNYQDPKWSYPTYDGCNVGGTTDLSRLSAPAVESAFTAGLGTATDATCTINNHLAKDMNGCYMEFPMPILSGGYYYVLENGTPGEVYDNKASGPSHRIYQMRCDVPAGQVKAVRVRKSARPDITPPKGSVTINDGAPSTTSRRVTLDIKVTDAGGSGINGMMVSNRSDFRGASWESFSSRKSWMLEDGDIGPRRVYVKVRDGAMPPNTAVFTDDIIYGAQVDPGGPNRVWYFAEGCTRAGFEEWLSIQNPNDKKVDLDITYMTATGHNVSRSLTAAPHSRATISVNEAVGPDQDVSARVEASLPVVAERPMYFGYGPGWVGGSAIIGTNSPKSRWYFAEGCTREDAGFNCHTWLCLQNPGERDARATVTYMLEGGGVKKKEISLPAKSRATECANWTVGPGHDVSALVEATAPIVCERPMYFVLRGDWNGGHAVLGTSAPANEWYLAEGTTHAGFLTYVCLQNPGKTAAGVTVDFMLQGASAKPLELQLPASSRKTILVNDHVPPGHNVSVRINSDRPIVAERPMYFSYGPGWNGGSCVNAAMKPHRKWSFAEGCTRPGFEQWFCIQNPGDSDARVLLEYALQDGTVKKQEVRVPAESRFTVKVNDALGNGHYDVATTVSSGTPIIVERPMYFNYKGKWAGGDCVMGSGSDDR